MKKIAVFPGSFDPITVGHKSIVLRALPLFDEVIVAIGVNPTKKSMFSIEQREEWCRIAFKDYPNVKVCSFNDLTVRFCEEVGAKYIIRGLRGSNDFEYENMINQANKLMAMPTIKPIETIYLITDNEYVGVSSSVVREMYKHGCNIIDLVPEGVVLPPKEPVGYENF